MAEGGHGLFERARRLLAAPVFEGDEEKTRIAALLNVILLVVLGLAALFALGILATGRSQAVDLVAEGALVLVALGLMVLVRRGLVQLSAALLAAGLWVIVTMGTWMSGGLSQHGRRRQLDAHRGAGGLRARQ